MTVRRARNILDQQQHLVYTQKRRNSVASSYFTAAMITLLLAAVIFLLGLALIDYEVGSYFEEKPMINIVLPPQV
ncbi:MAG TPA: hypothetical protein EYG95_00940 [Campylobacterales bacterium]|nr:hypothetical protein [Campylobacterales bacterium]